MGEQAIAGSVGTLQGWEGILGVDIASVPSINTDSDSMATAEERVAFVSRYITPQAPSADASFHIIYHDNSRGLLGPSDWAKAVVLRVNPSDSLKWLAGASPKTHEDASEPLSRQRHRTTPDSWDVLSTVIFIFSKAPGLSGTQKARLSIYPRPFHSPKPCR
jgi:hypothetical protein